MFIIAHYSPKVNRKFEIILILFALSNLILPKYRKAAPTNNRGGFSERKSHNEQENFGGGYRI